LQLSVANDALGAAREAARHLAMLCMESVTQRGRAVIALSGGETPWSMLAALRDFDVPWDRLCVAQVDERVAPDGDAQRNLTRLSELLVASGLLRADRLLAMPVTDRDLDHAAREYQRTLERVAGQPATLDLVHLGLGTDGHTASLVPGDPVTDVLEHDVAVSGFHAGHRRMTLTLPILSRARQRMWLITGAAKSTVLRELLDGRGQGPGLRLPREHSSIFADAAASST
jgi:6-phosphogluconolactonase